VIYFFEDYSLDTDRRELRRGTQFVAVEPQVFDCLQFLICNRERVVSKDDLIAAVWGGRIVSESTLSSRFTALRHAVGDSGETQRLIRTIHRRGLRFVGEIREEHRSGSAEPTPLEPKPLARPDKPSIAVLPFTNLSGDPEQDYFADGIVEDIITALSRVHWLFVIARNSSFTFKGRTVDVKQVGRELGVRYVLEGSVRKAAHRVRITGKLVDAVTGAHIWADRFDGELDDIFDLQDRVAASVAGIIEPKLRDVEMERARPDRVRRIGVLTNLSESDPDAQARVTAFRQVLEKLGWTVGRNLQIDYRWGASDVESARAAAAELLRLAPEVILANGSPPLAVMQQATRSVPIVFTSIGEPVKRGFVQSIAHPGSNITGFTNLEPSFGAKWLEMLKEIAPGVTRATVMFNPQVTPVGVDFFHSAEAVAPKFAVEAVMAPVHDLAEIEAVMRMVGRKPGGGLICPGITTFHHTLIAELAAHYRVPAIYGWRFFVAEGGLLSYGIEAVYQSRQAAAYVDRILRGEQPANLPVEQATKFELVINLKAAKALGLTVPQSILARADELIE
jgi:putative ABC transport system substrate-binding protein